jgi:hypothetical protein
MRDAALCILVHNAGVVIYRNEYATIQINHQLDATVSPVYYPDVYVRLNMFRASSRPSSVATTTAVAASGLPLERGGSSVVGRGRAG